MSRSSRTVPKAAVFNSDGMARKRSSATGRISPGTVWKIPVRRNSGDHGTDPTKTLPESAASSHRAKRMTAGSATSGNSSSRLS